MLADLLHRIATAQSLSLVTREKGFEFWPMLDLQDLQFLSLANLVHLIDETVGELL